MDSCARGNAILLNGVLQSANREIGVPGFRRGKFTRPRRLAGERKNSVLRRVLIRRAKSVSRAKFLRLDFISVLLRLREPLGIYLESEREEQACAPEQRRPR